MNVMAYDETSREDKIPIEYLSEEYSNEVEKSNKNIKYLVDETLNSKGGYSGRLYTNAYYQNNGYYCGPASAQIIIKYKTGSYILQSTLASELGTTSSSGTNVWTLNTVLNNHVGNNKYQCVYSSNTILSESMIYSIQNNYPLVYYVKLKELKGYENSTSESGHYIVGNGVSIGAFGSTGTSTVNYFDPYNEGQDQDEYINIKDAINARYGLYIRKS
jgi:hypothetical protein